MKNVPIVIPPTSTIPIELRATAPAPVTSVSGKCPTTVATVVISTGRSRVVAAVPGRLLLFAVDGLQPRR